MRAASGASAGARSGSGSGGSKSWSTASSVPGVASLEEETAEVLGRLIAFNTVNPPGNERAAAEWLRDYLADAGLETELDGAEEDRPNLVATLGDPDSGPVLGYLGHTDT